LTALETNNIFNARSSECRKRLAEAHEYLSHKPGDRQVVILAD